MPSPEADNSSMPERRICAGDVMTADIISVGPDAKVPDIARILLDCHVTGVPVIGRDGQVLGVVSETDLERAPVEAGATAEDVMSLGVVTIPMETDLEEVAHIFDQRRIRRAVVTRADGRPRGIITRSDVLRGRVGAWDRAGIPQEADMDLIRWRVADVLEEYGGATSTVRVVIVEGVAHLWGLAESENERRAVHGAVAVVPGVLGVDNHLVIQPRTMA